MTNSISTISVLNKPIEKTTENLPEKRCTKCGRIFLLTEEFFYRDKSKKNGFHSYCKVCGVKHHKEYREKNRDKLKEKSKEYYERNLDKIKEYHKEYNKLNKDKRKEYCETNKDRIKEYRKEYYESNLDKEKERDKEYRLSPCLFDSAPAQRLSLYDEVRENQDGYLELRCLYCGKWIQPTVSQVIARLNACELEYSAGESRIYCNDNNDQCKLACPTYRQQIYPKGFKPATSREVEPLIRQLCFERDNWTCQHCGVTSRDAQLHCHHIIGVVHSPMEQNDISNTITLCKACHKALHKKSGCRYQDYKCA